MCATKTNFQAYHEASEWARYEARDLWQTFTIFLLANALFMGALLNTIEDTDRIEFAPAVFAASLLGLLLCVPWFATYARNRAYYFFRLLRARELEPEGWDILEGRGVLLSCGHKIRVSGQDIRIPWFARFSATKYAAFAIIGGFAFCYAFVAVISGPWCNVLSQNT